MPRAILNDSRARVHRRAPLTAVLTLRKRSR